MIRLEIIDVTEVAEMQSGIIPPFFPIDSVTSTHSWSRSKV